MSVRGHVAVVAVALLAAGFVACGEDERRIGDAKIVDKLNLEEVEVEGGKEYAIDGDLFCGVERKLLNTSDEVEAADEQSDLVVASREGNVGVIGVPVFASDCREDARKKLNKLDPADG